MEKYLIIHGITSIEQYKEQVLHLNGIMTQELFNKVITELFEKESLDWETISY